MTIVVGGIQLDFTVSLMGGMRDVSGMVLGDPKTGDIVVFAPSRSGLDAIFVASLLAFFCR
jgi:hypothetical protein